MLTGDKPVSLENDGAGVLDSNIADRHCIRVPAYDCRRPLDERAQIIDETWSVKGKVKSCSRRYRAVKGPWL